MKRYIIIWIQCIIICIIITGIGCKKNSKEITPEGLNSKKSITVNFDFDEKYKENDPNIYVIWLENSSKRELQHIYVCERLTDGSLDSSVKKTALPFWHMHRYNRKLRKDIDSVTGATIVNQDFSKTVEIDPKMGTNFTLYFEIDQSFQWNDWFGGPYLFDQQAVLYRADINLEDSVTEYILEPVGWTPNQDYTIANVLRPAGELVSEIRFITHSKVDDQPTFGGFDKETSAIRSISMITAQIH